jgi:hypothetical protein
MKATGANSVEFPVMWFYDNNNETEMYPITALGSSLRTSTDDEAGQLAAIPGGWSEGPDGGLGCDSGKLTVSS